MRISPQVFFLAAGGLLLAAVPGCRTKAPAAAPAADTAAELIRFERTACMGPCPVDVLVLYADGRMRYDGREKSPRTGIYTGQLSEAERQALVQEFEAARFFEFAPVYTSQLSDRPTYYLTFTSAGRRHRVKDYDNAPAQLHALEDSLIQLIKAPRWRLESGPLGPN